MTVGKLNVRFGQPGVWVDDGDLAVHCPSSEHLAQVAA
jgi:hypothetical protein